MTKKTERTLLFLIFILCLSIRIAFITQKNLWFDEVFSWHLSLNSFYEIIVRTSNDIHPPLYYFVLKIWNGVFGDSVLSMRFPSALFSSIAIFLIYPIARRILDPVNSLIVLILYSVSPLNLYYSQEARMAAMNMFLNICSVYFLIRLEDKLSRKTNAFNNGMFYLYIISTVAALYTHYFSFFILAAEIIYLICLYRADFKKYIPYLAAYLGIGLLYLMWAGIFVQQITRGQSWRAQQTSFQVLNEYTNYFKDLNFGLYYHYTNLTLIKYLTILLFLGVVIAVIGLFLKNKSGKSDNSNALILLLTIVPLVLAGITSFKQKVEFYRYLSILVPFILITLVYGISKWNNKLILYSFVGLFIASNIFGLCLHYSFTFKNDDYRALINKIDSNYMTGDRIYVEPHYYGWLIEYYNKQNNVPVKPAYIRYGWNEILDSINTQKPERFWVVFDYSSVDTTKFNDYKSGLERDFEKDFNMTYYLAPTKVELYRFLNK